MDCQLTQPAQNLSETEIKRYIQAHYGQCIFAQETGKGCACLRGQRYADQSVCPDWSPVTASSWAELFELAVSRYQSK